MTDYINRRDSIRDFERCNAVNPHWTGRRMPEVDLYLAQMKIRFEKEF